MDPLNVTLMPCDSDEDDEQQVLVIVFLSIIFYISNAHTDNFTNVCINPYTHCNVICIKTLNFAKVKFHT